MPMNYAVLRSRAVTSAGDATLLPVAIPGPAGSLEGLLRSPAAPAGAAIVAHPHPQHGGTMHTKVVHRTAKLLSGRFSLAALRFNFRGVGGSAGAWDEGRGEADDLVAAAEWIRARQPAGPFVVGGFSFGSLCALRAAPRLKPDVLLLIGLPVDRWDGAAPAAQPWRVVWIQGDEDEFSPPAKARVIASNRGWTFLSVPGADHFFTGKLDEFERTAGDAVAQALL
jgi:alpha/beta superfamily hydrolase